MQMLEFVRNYWGQIIFISGILIGFLKFSLSMIEAVKCSLRNDILAIWDKCKETGQITKYQLQGLSYSYKLYKKLGGNSFVDEIFERIKSFEIID